MSGDCIDVCSEVLSVASDLGLDVGEDEDHEPVFEAMDKMFSFLRANKDAFQEELALGGHQETEEGGLGGRRS